MALVLKDRVKEQTTTTGTGTVTLGGALSGFDTFASVGNGNTTYYAIVHQTADEWEVGLGTYTAVGTLLSRDTVLESSNADAAVVFSAGTKDVFVTYPSDKAVYADAAGEVSVTRATSTTFAASATNATFATSATNATTAINVSGFGIGGGVLLNSGVSVSSILDEDNMASNSATALSTQQSIKAYVDAQVGTADTLSEVLALGNTTGGTDIAMTGGDKITNFESTGINDDATSTAITIDSAGNVGIGLTDGSGYGKFAAKGGKSGTATSSAAFITPGAAQAEVADLALYSTFTGTGDNGPRRTADILAGMTANWGSEYLTLNVGNNGAANDTQLVTSEKMRITRTGYVGIGTAAPGTTLHVVANTNPGVRLDYYENGIGGASYSGRKGRGTAASPTAVVSNDYLSAFLASGYGSTGFSANVGLIGFRASQTFTDAAQGNHITFENTPDGSTSRSERMRITSAGNVGIGTSTAATKLSFPIGTSPTIGQTAGTNHAAGNVGSIGIGINDGGGYSGVYVHNTHNGTYSSQDIRFSSAEGGVSVTTERMRITSGGSVGIGSSTPESWYGVNTALLVNRAQNQETTLGIGNTTSGSSAATALYMIGGTGNSWTKQSLVDNTGSPYFASNFGSAVTFASWVFGGTERMRITSAGNVGIGTTAPTAELDIESTSPEIHLNDSDGVLGGAVTSRMIFQASGSTQGIVGLGTGSGTMAVTNNQGSLLLQADTNNAQASSYVSFTVDNAAKMRIDSNGNVGIGTTAPSYKLHVAGDIYSSGDVISASDIRYKENLKIIPDAVDKINKLNGYTFTRTDTDNKNKKYAGVIAQEVQEVLPEVVSTNNEGYLTVSYGNMVSLLIEGIKEQHKEIEELKAAVQQLINNS